MYNGAQKSDIYSSYLLRYPYESIITSPVRNTKWSLFLSNTIKQILSFLQPWTLLCLTDFLPPFPDVPFYMSHSLQVLDTFFQTGGTNFLSLIKTKYLYIQYTFLSPLPSSLFIILFHTSQLCIHCEVRPQILQTTTFLPLVMDNSVKRDKKYSLLSRYACSATSVSIYSPD